MDHHSLRDVLHRLAANHRWTWAVGARALLESLPGAETGLHPVRLVRDMSAETLDSLLSDHDWVSRVNHETAELDRLTAGRKAPVIAYCSPEFGITAQMPQYAGGLGVLAGDHLKTASDLGLSLAGVGLFYRQGVFHQVIEGGKQVERYETHLATDFGAVDTGIVVEVSLPGRQVLSRVWRLDVGRVPLLLLDTHLEANDPADRQITDQLYIGFTEHRVDQEMILGIGGAKALSAMGWPVELHHLNEGHAGFIVLELVDQVIEDGDIGAAVDQVRSKLVFTTHTPVPAGIDRFHRTVVEPYLTIWAERWSVPLEEIWELGVDPADPDHFNMAALCLRSASAANGVSEQHGVVSRDLFAGCGLGDDIGSVTNGVHARTWTAPHFQAAFDGQLGDGWADGEAEAWEGADNIDDSMLADLRAQSSKLLVEMVAGSTGDRIDPDGLIVGFARRFAPYKRATLLMRDKGRLGRLLGDDGRPIHFVFAGKAHPSDDMGKGLVAEVLSYAGSKASNRRVSFIPDYDMRIGHLMTQGCDIWLNNPIRPREASGTSGEKAVLNGGLNCSILDGWWAEMYDGGNGWAIPSSESADPQVRDDEEARALMDTLEAIVSEYHEQRPVFYGRVRHAWKTLGPRVTSARMLRDYMAGPYASVLSPPG